MKPFVMVVDGIIGAGKSTLLDKCIKPIIGGKYRTVIIPEPIEQWKSNGRLEQFYKDPSRRAYQFQTRVFHDRIKTVRECVSKADGDVDLYVLERSIFTDVLFMKTLFDRGEIDITEYEDYNELWKMWANLMPFEIDLFLYLKPSIETVMTRLAIRNRKGEGGVSLEYQKNLEKHHNEFFESHPNHFTLETESDFRDCPVTKKDISDTITREIRRKIHFQNKKCDSEFYIVNRYENYNPTSQDEEWAVILETIFKLVEEFSISPETTCLGFEIFEMVSPLLDPDAEQAIYAFVSFNIAVKFIETESLLISYFVDDNTFSKKEFEEAELLVLSLINFDIKRDTRYNILFLTHGVEKHTEFTVSASCILLFSYYDRYFMNIKPKKLVDSVITATRLLLGEKVENDIIVRRIIWNLKRRKIGSTDVMSMLRNSTKLHFLKIISDFVVSKF